MYSRIFVNSHFFISYRKSTFKNDDTEDILNDGVFEGNIELEILLSCVDIHDVETWVQSSNIWGKQQLFLF